MSSFRAVASRGLLFGALSVGAAIAACKDDGAPARDLSGLSDACARWGRAMATSPTLCANFPFGDGFNNTPTADAARMQAICVRTVNAPGITIDTAWVTRCATAVENGQCGDTCIMPDGSLADGVVCRMDEQCKTGWCSRGCFHEISCGVCTPRHAHGAACVVQPPTVCTECVRGDRCNPERQTCDLDSSPPAGAYPRPLRGSTPPGAPCDPSPNIQPPPCAIGSCSTATTMSPTQGLCPPVIALGQACRGPLFDTCGDINECIDGICQAPFDACTGVPHDAGALD